jgi:ABC-2 type transport system permease protein
VRSSWGFVLAAAVVMVGIGTIAGFEAAAEGAGPGSDPAWAIAPFAAMPAQFALLALGLTAVTADYATGGIVPALQWTPRRGTLFVARTVVAVAVATILGVLLGAGSAVAAHAAAPSLGLPWDAGLDVLGALALVFSAGTALAVGLGFLLRNTAGAIVTVFLVMLLLPILLPQFGYEWMSWLASVLPGSGAAFLLLGEVPRMTVTSSVTVLLGWTGGALLLGWLRLARSDANR